MRVLGILVGLTTLVVSEAWAAPPPVEAFGRIPQVDHVTLSPGGKLVAWQDNTGARPAVVVFSLETQSDQKKFDVGPNNKLRGIHWADDATLLFNASVTHALRVEDGIHTYEWFRTLSADLDTGKTKMLLMTDPDRQFVTGAPLLAVRTAKPKTVTMASWDYLSTMERPNTATLLPRGRKDSGWVQGAFSVDTRTGQGTVLAWGSQFTDDWVVDTAGQPVARSDWDPERKQYTILAKDGMAWRKIHSQRDAGELVLAGLSSDGKAVLARGANGQQRAKLWSIPLDGSGAQVLIEDPEREVTGIDYDPLTLAPVAAYLGGLSVERRWLDKKAQVRHEAVARAFAERDVLIVGRAEDYHRVVVHVESPSHAPIYYLVDFGTKEASIVGEAYPALAKVRLGEVRGITYQTRDGASVPAYLTLPVGMVEKDLPLVVLPHGGPQARDYFEFDWWAQFLASRGYAVVQPQFRGSTGFGEAHRQAGRRQWGTVMQDDVTDAVKTLIEQGLVDPRRVCIVGASYGGYAALAGAAFTPELYACAASINGVSDLPELIAFAERKWGDDSDSGYYMRDLIGRKGDPKIAEKSPARAAATVKAPVLLIHAVDDTVVPIAQSKKMERALAALGRPVKLVELKGEDHWLSRSETRIRVLAELESFLGAHLTAVADAAAPPARTATDQE